MIQAVSFDCAQTLIEVDWRPAMLAVECAQEAGLEFDDVEAASAYDRLLRRGWGEFQDLNRTRDETLTDAFWHRLTAEWAREMNFPTTSVEPLLSIAEQRLFGDASTVFSLYPDVVPCLDALRRAGLKMAVVSNWDISLHKTLRRFGLSDYFLVVVASMEEGIEKPDTRIFEVALSRLGVSPSACVHVGDNPVDDLMGAKRAGMRGFVIDRAVASDGGVYLNSLTDLPGRLGL